MVQVLVQGVLDGFEEEADEADILEVRDALANMSGKCHVCHMEKTEQERLMGLSRRIPVESTLSADLLELLHVQAGHPLHGGPLSVREEAPGHRHLA